MFKQKTKTVSQLESEALIDFGNAISKISQAAAQIEEKQREIYDQIEKLEMEVTQNSASMDRLKRIEQRIEGLIE